MIREMSVTDNMSGFLCVGLVVCDILVKPVCADALRVDSSRIDTLELCPGGDAMNVACNLSRLGLDVTLVGRVGEDGFGRLIRDELTKAGVTDALIVDGTQATSTSLVLIEENGERHFLYYGKTNDMLRRDDVPDVLLRQARHMHIGSAFALRSLDGDGMVSLLRDAKQLGVTTSLDTTCDTEGVWYGKIKEGLPFIDFFMPSIDEARSISQAFSPEEIERFFQRTGIGCLVIKLGERGCYVTDFTRRATIDPYPEKQKLDTTGAGDAFVAGFLSGIAQRKDIFHCGRRGNALAARCIEGYGAQVRGIDDALRRMLDHLK